MHKPQMILCAETMLFIKIVNCKSKKVDRVGLGWWVRSIYSMYVLLL